MASISSLGIGSGLDIQGLVTSLVEAEGAAKSTRLDRKQVDYEAKLSMYSTVKSALSDFRSSFSKLRLTSSFNVLAGSVSNSEVFSASISSSAEIAKYDIEVSQLAQSQRLNSAGYADKNSTVVGTGTLVLNYGTYTYDGGGNPDSFTADPDASTVEIDINTGTLEDIRDSINDADAGVSASIINDPVDGYKLVLTSDTGENNALNITWQGRTDANGDPVDPSDDLSALEYDPLGTYGGAASLSETQKALSANATIDGVAITSESNTIDDVIDNVSLTLNGVSDKVETLDIQRSTTNIEEAVQTFVDGYNNLMATLSSASFYDEDTGNSGILIGDATVRGIVNQIRNVLNTTVNNDPTVQYNSLASLGILTARDGSLEYDATKLQAALNSKPDEVQFLLAGGKAETSSSYFSINSITDNIPAGTYSVEASGGTSGTILGAFVDTDIAGSALDFSAGGPHDLVLSVDGVTTSTYSFGSDYYNGGSNSNAVARTLFLNNLQTQLNADANLISAGLSVTAEWVFEDAGNPDSYALKLTSNSFGVESKITISDDLEKVNFLAASATVDPGNQNFEIGGEAALYKDGLVTGTGIYAGFELALRGTLPASFVSSINVNKGSISSLDSLISSFLDSDGLLSSKTDGLNASLRDIESQREDLALRLEKIETQYIKKFSAMDALVAQLNSTSSYLENQLKALPGVKRD